MRLMKKLGEEKEPANPRKNPGCREDHWKDFSAEEKLLWKKLFRAYNTSVMMPAGVHVLHSVVRDLAMQYATVAIWTLRFKRQEKVSGSTEAEDRADPIGVRSQDEAR